MAFRAPGAPSGSAQGVLGDRSAGFSASGLGTGPPDRSAVSGPSSQYRLSRTTVPRTVSPIGEMTSPSPPCVLRLRSRSAALSGLSRPASGPRAETGGSCAPSGSRWERGRGRTAPGRAR
nr:hypothetical protein GCM10020093_081470 [Planobispora longispora]